MSRFSTSAANDVQNEQPQVPTPHTEQDGIDLHLEFKPTETVWYMTDHGVQSATVIKINVELRSLISTQYEEHRTITYLLSNGLERRDNEVFATKKALIASL